MNTDHLTCNSNHGENETDKIASKIIGERGSRDQKLKLRALHTPYGFRDVTYSSNLEFTRSMRDRNLPHSLIYMKPDVNNITPQKIILEITDSKAAVPKQMIIKEIEETPSLRQAESEAQDLNPVDMKDVLRGRDAVPLYEVWPGKNRFFWKGRLMTGPRSDKKTNIIAWIITLTISAIFFGLGWSLLLGEVTLILPILSVFLFLCTVVFFLLASFTDPGIIPRKQISELCGNNSTSPLHTSMKKEGTSSSQNTSYQITLDSTKRKSTSKSLSSKSCQICNITKPNKTTHCKYCGNCVEGFERHCHFLNNCVGKRNYKYFVGLVVSIILLGVSYVFGFLVIIITRTANDPDVDKSTVFLHPVVTVIIIIILGVPSAVLLLMILLFCFLQSKCYLSRDNKYQSPTQNQGGAIISLFTWLYHKPSLFKPQQLISQENLLLYQDYIKRIIQEKA